MFIIFDQSLNGILNALLISGFTMLTLSIIDLLRLNIIKGLSLVNLVILDNIPISGIFITYYFDNNYFGSVIIDFLIFNCIALLLYLCIASVTYIYFKRGIVTYVRNFFY